LARTDWHDPLAPPAFVKADNKNLPQQRCCRNGAQSARSEESDGSCIKTDHSYKKKKECNSSPRSGSRSLCPFRVAARDKGFTIDSSTAFHDPELAYLPHVMTSIPESSLLPHLSNKKQPPCCELNSKTIYPAGGNINRALSEPDSVPTNEIDVFSSKSVDLLPYSVV